MAVREKTNKKHKWTEWSMTTTTTSTYEACRWTSVLCQINVHQQQPSVQIAFTNMICFFGIHNLERPIHKLLKSAAACQKVEMLVPFCVYE
jgi:hypothetical protein